jgi:hypothetical protein
MIAFYFLQRGSKAGYDLVFQAALARASWIFPDESFSSETKREGKGFRVL